MEQTLGKGKGQIGVRSGEARVSLVRSPGLHVHLFLQLCPTARSLAAPDLMVQVQLLEDWVFLGSITFPRKGRGVGARPATPGSATLTECLPSSLWYGPAVI